MCASFQSALSRNHRKRKWDEAKTYIRLTADVLLSTTAAR